MTPVEEIPLKNLQVPPGFQVEIWAHGMPGNRMMTRGDKGTVFAGTRTIGRVYAITDKGGQRTSRIIAEKLVQPNGVLFVNGSLYVAAINHVYRYDNIEDAMAELFKGWSDPELQDVAAYLSRQRSLPGKADKDSQRYERGAGLARAMGCGSCHLADFTGQQQVPRIAKQREDYLLASMKAYRDNKRTGTDTNMNGVLYQVPDGDLAALAHYLAHQ